MTKIGFHASHEQHSPSFLLDCLKRAERVGFQAGMCSDHFHPWSERQGQSGFAWSWLGAALEATTLSLGPVCAPGQRYHPAIIAQAAATLAEMYPGRFWLAVGSGEALNESITGDPWPTKPERNRRLKESVDILRDLWHGDTVTHNGLVRVSAARLYTRPVEPPPIFAAAITEETAEWAGSWADGLITIVKPRAEQRRMISAFRRGGGARKPIYLQAALCYAPTYDEALADAFDQWRQSTLTAEQILDLPTPRAFDTATEQAKPRDLEGKLRISANLDEHVAWLQEDMDLGFDAIYLHHIGRDLPGFIDLFGREVLPRL